MQAIKFKRTGVTGKIPTPEALEVGEIAIQLADHVIFTKDKEHKVVQISVSPETHAELESKVDAHKEELDQTIALNDQTIHAKVDEIKAATDATITANHEAINLKVDTIQRETDATILANKNKAASDLAAVNEEINTTIEVNKTLAATATTELDTRINKKVDDIKKRTDETVAANDLAIHEKVDQIKTDTDRTIASNAEHAQNQLDAVDSRLTGVIADNKEIAAQAVTALSSTVEQKDLAIHKKVDGNKEFSDSEIARLDSRIDNIDGSSDGKFIKRDHGTFNNAYLLSKTPNYSDDPAVSGKGDYLDYFGAYRMNGMDNWGEATGLILNVPHSYGKAHGRGFEFQYGSAGAQVRTYGIGADGVKAFSHRMYHEGDKPTPAELNIYSKDEINKMFQKTIWIDPTGGWFKIATITAGQNWGKGCNIRLIGGNGYNLGSWGQTKIVELVMRNSNDNPRGMNLVAYENTWSGTDQHCCFVNTSGDTYDIYVWYGGHSCYVMAQYQESNEADLIVYDNPQLVEQKPENAVDGMVIRAFTNQINRGTLNFNANGHEYDIEHMTTAPAGRKSLRKYRSQDGGMIWHETVNNTVYTLFTGNGHDSYEFELIANGSNRGAHVTAGRFIADAGNDAFQIRYVPSTESAMLQIWERGTSNLNAYFGYGSNNENNLTIYNRLGDINIAPNNGSVNFKGNSHHYGGVNYHSSNGNASTHTFNLGVWGNSGSGGNRNAVYEVADGASWHFYSQRLADNTVEFSVVQHFSAGSNITAHGNLLVRGGHGIEIACDGNRHIWFRDNSGVEKGVLYAENDGGVKLRTSNQQFSTHFHNGMIHITGQQTNGSDRGLIRGTVVGGAWADWQGRAAGILVDCPDSRNSAYSIWKATHWGEQHLAAMGVHAGGGNPSVGMHVGGAAFWWSNNGEFNASGNGNFNDVYIRSDARLKINVEDYEDNAIDLIGRLKVKTYDKVKSLSDREVVGHEIGIIAQDLQKILPEAVKATNAGSPDEPEEILTISNSAVNALLIKAVQEMSKEIAELKAKIK